MTDRLANLSDFDAWFSKFRDNLQHHLARFHESMERPEFNALMRVLDSIPTGAPQCNASNASGAGSSDTAMSASSGGSSPATPISPTGGSATGGTSPSAADAGSRTGSTPAPDAAATDVEPVNPYTEDGKDHTWGEWHGWRKAELAWRPFTAKLREELDQARNARELMLKISSNALRAKDREIAAMREVLQDFADAGCRHDLTPTMIHVQGDTDRVHSAYRVFMERMDKYVRSRAKEALAAPSGGEEGEK